MHTLEAVDISDILFIGALLSSIVVGIIVAWIASRKP